MEKGELAHLAVAGAEIAVLVTPKAARNRIVAEGNVLRVYVTTVPEGGKATAEVQKMLARALGVPKRDVTLVWGATARQKVFRIG
jgi:uncharacterized protein YggU (UPF0235/DUF167 family)